jgi:hypothetical protein
VAVAVAIVLLVIVFTRHSNSQQNCIPVTGGQPAELNCQ